MPQKGEAGWWTQFYHKEAKNLQDRPWAECELTFVSGPWPCPAGQRQEAHVIEGRPLRELTQEQLHDKERNLLRGPRSAWVETHELPRGAPRWKPKQKQATTTAPKRALFFGCHHDEEGADPD